MLLLLLICGENVHMSSYNNYVVTRSAEFIINWMLRACLQLTIHCVRGITANVS